jgi:hypothetical protein
VDTGQTGYIEYTAVGWTQDIQHRRLVYNYYEDAIYLTIHYQQAWFGENTSPFLLVNRRLGLGVVGHQGRKAGQQASLWAL